MFAVFVFGSCCLIYFLIMAEIFLDFFFVIQIYIVAMLNGTFFALANIASGVHVHVHLFKKETDVTAALHCTCNGMLSSSTAEKHGVMICRLSFS